MFAKIVLSAFLLKDAAATGECNSSCSSCTALPSWMEDSQCDKCLDGHQWWPCNDATICQCQNGNDAVTQSPSTGEQATQAPGGACNSSCSSCIALPTWMNNSQCDKCLDGYQWWPCNDATLCQCQNGDGAATTSSPSTGEQNGDGAVTTPSPSTGEENGDGVVTTPSPSTGEENEDGVVTTPSPSTGEENEDGVVTTPSPSTGEEVETEVTPTEDESQVTPTEDETQAMPTEDDMGNSAIDTTVRRAQASVFGDYTTINWNQVLCSQDESDAKPYMQGNPMCATAISMGSASVNSQGSVDQNGNPGFCMRSTPGNGAAKASSCWKVKCVGGDNALGVGVSCKHDNPIYLKTVDTNMENSLSLTDDQFTNQCANLSSNTPSCRAFDITVQAWDLIVVFADNQGSMAGEPAGLNGSIPIEYEEVDCEDAVVKAAIHDSHCGLPSTLLI